MLPDFIYLKEKVKGNLNQYIRIMSKNDPLIANIREELIFEGDGIVYHTIDGEEQKKNYDKIKSEFKLKDEEIIDKGPMALIPLMRNLGKDIESQKSKHILKELKETTEKAGNVIDGKGKKINPDIILQCLEKIQIDFDENGNPYMPALFVDPKMADYIKGKIPEWEKDIEHKKKHEELMKKKKEEWHDRESNRKLVD